MRTFLRIPLLAVLVLLATPQAKAQPNDAAEFLSRLEGCWRLEGRMGEAQLHQNVEARWVLGRRFIEMRFSQSDDPGPDRDRYEALYLLGYDAQAHRYVLNLFDIFGVTTPVPGLGLRDGNQVRFYFPYDDGDFYNTFRWDEDTQAWTMLLERHSGNGALTVFAAKHMTRCPT
jgi:hypothetical protein